MGAGNITQDQFQYIIDELQFYGKLPNRGFVSPVDGVCQSDELISVDLRKELETGVKVLEDGANDWRSWLK